MVVVATFHLISIYSTDILAKYDPEIRVLALNIRIEGQNGQESTNPTNTEIRAVEDIASVSIERHQGPFFLIALEKHETSKNTGNYCWHKWKFSGMKCNMTYFKVFFFIVY